MKLNLRPIISLIAAALLLGTSNAGARLAGAYYGTNYTVPFAHAYRALGELGVDRHEAIDRDVYHMSRLGLNAFRLHLWDVELSDAKGNLLDNEHLELLDYLIAQLEKRNIAVILTAQTNFGNGYPERNSDPNGAYSYRYAKCNVHDDPEAQAAQERYLDALVRHSNRYTGRTYADDSDILAIEINNEPCHSGTHEQITAYVDRMANALRKAGWKKDILYNVSHNLWRTGAFYRAAIAGTTYQWYPTGLVRGSRRQGNFLPVLDSYDVPFDTVPGYAEQPRFIYEYDPADVLDSYLYPAAARTFRKAGFTWVTQFAYDPVDMARFNTEYQTHFLNTAYTPGKAAGMAIAAEVMRRTPMGADYGKYPVDTVFGDFLVSARRDLAMLNDGEKYYHTNRTDVAPLKPAKLKRIIGVGSSPVVTSDGTGIYFADRLEKGVWRLEILPDVVITEDPFARPSLHREVARTIDAPVALTLELPGLADGFAYSGTRGKGTATGRSVTLKPGVYLLGDASKFDAWTADRVYDNERNLVVGEYTMPYITAADAPVAVVHTPAQSIDAGAPLCIEATIVSGTPVDSAFVYPAEADFWRDDNTIIPLEKTGKYSYRACIDPGLIDGKNRFAYSIVVYAGGRAATFPAAEPGAPLDWDFGAGRTRANGDLYTTAIVQPGAPTVLLDFSAGLDGAEYSSIPESWRGQGMAHSPASAFGGKGAARLYRNADAEALETMIITKYVRPAFEHRKNISSEVAEVRFGAAQGLDSINLGFVTADGFTYATPLAVKPDGTAEVRLADLRLAPTLLTPAPYPSFLQRRFVPDAATAVPFNAADIEQVVLYTDGTPHGAFDVEIQGVRLR